MLHTFARAAALIALLCPQVFSIAIGSPPATPEVPWKYSKRGLFDRGYGDDSSCAHGPSTRTCWGGGYSVSTDMDLKWPSTGKCVKVGCKKTLNGETELTENQYNWEITNTTLAPDGFARWMNVVNGQYPGPVSRS